MQGKTRREITEVRCVNWTGLPIQDEWYVYYKIWNRNGQFWGDYYHYVTDTPDEAGAMLKTLAHWARQDARNERRRQKKEQDDAA